MALIIVLGFALLEWKFLKRAIPGLRSFRRTRSERQDSDIASEMVRMSKIYGVEAKQESSDYSGKHRIARPRVAYQRPQFALKMSRS